MESAENFEAVCKTHSLITNPVVIVDCEKQKQEKILNFLEKCENNGIKQRLILIANESFDVSKLSNDILHVQVVHDSSHLTAEVQEKLVKLQVNFQGAEMSLKQLLVNCVGSDQIKTMLLNDLMTGKNIEIGREFEFNEIHVERIYVPFNHQSNFSATKKFNIERFLELVGDTKTVVMSGEPGLGKSTELKFLTKKFKQFFPTHWIVYVDLKQFTEAFQKDGKVTMTFEDKTAIAKFLCEKVLKIKGFEAIFTNLFNQNRTIILIDGFDEVSPTYKNFIKILSTGITENSKNRLIIATRPHLVKELTETLTPSHHFQLKPFSNGEQRQFFTKFLESKGLDQETVEKSLKQVEEFVDSMIEASSSDWIANPLLMKMITEIFDDDDGEDCFAKTNYFSIYDKFIGKIINRFQNNGPEAKNYVTLNLRNAIGIFKIQQQLALKTIFQNCSIKMNDFCKPCVLSAEQTVRVGFMYDDSGDFSNLQFTHKTYAEFFVAEFLYKKICLQDFEIGEDLETVIELFLAIIGESEYDFRMIRVFMDHALESFEDHENAEKTKIVQDRFKFALAKFNCGNFFLMLIKNDFLNLAMFITTKLFKDKATVFKLWLGKPYFCDSVMTSVAEYQTLKFIQKCWSFAAEMFGLLELKMLLLQKHGFFDASPSIFRTIAREVEDFEILKFFIEIAKKLMPDDELKEILLANDMLCQSIFYHALENRKNDLAFTEVEEVLKGILSKSEVELMIKHAFNPSPNGLISS